MCRILEKYKLHWRNHLERMAAYYRARKISEVGIPYKKMAHQLLRNGMGPCSLILEQLD
jgi:hypothetical protein